MANSFQLKSNSIVCYFYRGYINVPKAIDIEPKRRRVFAIISHPDAGKTTLTENMLLAAGAIHQAGRVAARGEARRTQSDWMKIEQERGISVSSSVMTFEHQDLIFQPARYAGP